MFPNQIPRPPVPGGYQCKVEISSPVARNANLEEETKKLKDNVRFTLPKTNVAGWKIHHFDGIYKETWGFSWAMLVSGRVLLQLFRVCVVIYLNIPGNSWCPFWDG